MTPAERAAALRRQYETARSLQQQNRLAEAEKHYRELMRSIPDHPGVLHGLGLIAIAGNRNEAAVQLLERAARMAPADANIASDLGVSLLMLAFYKEAAGAFETSLRLRPGHVPALIGLGEACNALGRHDDAAAAYTNLLRLEPNSAPAHFGLGNVAMQLGRMHEAGMHLARAIALAPKNSLYHRTLGDTARFHAGDPRLAPMESLFREADALSDRGKVDLHFALAKAYDDLDRHGESFAQLKAGNALKRSMVDYDEDRVLAHLKGFTEAFSPELIESRKKSGFSSRLPIFVVGMPRSGTSLVEQILDSHAEIFGAGELIVMNELVGEGLAGSFYPTGIDQLPGEAVWAIGQRYVDAVRRLAPDAPRIVDKLPANFRHLGLIHMALPDARIIHVRRDAADTCFSCYTKTFSSGLNFAYDLGELGRYYRAYETLMAHWRAVLPPDALLEVQYESLVGDLEGEARRMISFLDLAWDQNCLKFHTNQRAVRTLSRTQVREPLYRSSIGRAKVYERWLDPLYLALK